MFVMKKYVEETWTPELGGVFEGLKLKIKMLTPADYQAKIADNATQKTVDGRPSIEFNVINAIRNAVTDCLKQVVDWSGTDSSFSPALRDSALALMVHDKTGIIIDGKEEEATLQDYVSWFAAEKANFLAPSANS
jgi:hypothetical protein